MNTTKHLQRRKTKRRSRAKRAAKEWAAAKSPAERAMKTAAKRAAAERAAAEQAAAERRAAARRAAARAAVDRAAARRAKSPAERALSSLKCLFGRHHWEDRRAQPLRFRECTECGQRQNWWPGYRGDPRGLGASHDGDGVQAGDPGAGLAGRSEWLGSGDTGDFGDGGGGGDWGGE